MPTRNASHQDKDRPLQGYEPPQSVPECQVRLSWILLPAPSRHAPVRPESGRRVHAGGQPCGTEGHARDDPGLEYPATDPEDAGGCRSDAQSGPQRWIEYYGRYTPSALYPLFPNVNATLLAWAQRKFKRFKAHKVRARVFLLKLAQTRADLFVHWQRGMIGGFA